MELHERFAGESLEANHFLFCQRMRSIQGDAEFIRVDVFFLEVCAAIRRQFSRKPDVDPTIIERGELLVRSQFIEPQLDVGKRAPIAVSQPWQERRRRGAEEADT